MDLKAKGKCAADDHDAVNVKCTLSLLRHQHEQPAFLGWHMQKITGHVIELTHILLLGRAKHDRSHVLRRFVSTSRFCAEAPGAV